jgi:hypothetical protein
MNSQSAAGQRPAVALSGMTPLLVSQPTSASFLKIFVGCRIETARCCAAEFDNIGCVETAEPPKLRQSRKRFINSRGRGATRLRQARNRLPHCTQDEDPSTALRNSIGFGAKDLVVGCYLITSRTETRYRGIADVLEAWIQEPRDVLHAECARIELFYQADELKNKGISIIPRVLLSHYREALT